MRRWVFASVLVAPLAGWLACGGNTASNSTSSDDAGCLQLANEAESALSPAEADQSCTKDSDCVLFSPGTTCVGSCDVVMNQAGAAALDAAIAQVNATTCAAFIAGGCGYYGPPPCHPTLGPSCVEGQCVGLPPMAEDAGNTCGEETDAAQAAVNETVAEAGTSCDATSDCTLVSTSTACTSSCNVAIVNQASAPQLLQAVAQISATDCSGYADAGCPNLLFPCPPLPSFACIAGSCVLGVLADIDAGD